MAKIAGAQKTATSNRSYTNGNGSGRSSTEIERLAYQFFVERGYAHGYDREDWLRAEAIVSGRNKS